MLPGTIPDKLEPHNVAAEEAVIGALLIDSDAILKVDTLEAKDFFIERNGFVFQVIKDLKGKADLIVISDELERRGQLAEIGGPARLSELITRTPSSLGVEDYVQIVKRTSGLRQQIHMAGEVARMAFQADADPEQVNNFALGKYLEIQSGLNDTRTSMTYREIVNRIHDQIEYLQHHPEAFLALSTGFRDIDKKMRGGFKEGSYILAGATHMGKTLLAQNIVENSAKVLAKQNAGSVLVFSLEMSPEQLVQRSLEGMTGFETGDEDIIRYMSKLTEDTESSRTTWSNFIKASSELADLPIRVVYVAGLTPMQLHNMSREYQHKENTQLIIVDYLQLMQAGDTGRRRVVDNRTQELGYISRQIKIISGELHLPILALSQLSRKPAGRTDKRPMLSDLRESGNIEENADVAMLLYRDGYYNPDTEFPNIMEVIFGKNRLDGLLGAAGLYYHKEQNRFRDLEVRRQPLEY